MKRSLGLTVVLACFVLIVMLGFVKPALSNKSPQTSKQLSASDQALANESRKSIIESGFSESYFDKHFKVFRVENKPSDRRVVWQLTINGYEAYITDSIGYYDEGTKRIDIHNVRQVLRRTTDIVKTISRAQALKLMRACIGSFSDPSVQFGGVGENAELLLVAHKKQLLSRREQEERERREAREREKEKGAKKNTGSDEIENEGEDGEGDPVIIGYINLQTGKCSKGKGVITP